MATAISLIILVGLLINYLFIKLRLPGILGMLISGIIMGPYFLDVIDHSLLKASADFRQLALIVILLRAGFGIKKNDLKKIGITSLRLAFIPVIIEGFTIAGLSIFILDISFIEGAILGFIIAAVSPAVVVPSMLEYTKKGYGKEKAIPTLILAGASIDDITAITFFTLFLGIHLGSDVSKTTILLNIPIAIISGLITGVLIGYLLLFIFKKIDIRSTKKVLILLGFSILLTEFEKIIRFSTNLEVATLLSIMTAGFVILEKNEKIAGELASKLNKIWIFAEILLFVLIGAQVNIGVGISAGIKGLTIISIGLIARSFGVLLSTIGSGLNKKEKLFCCFSYIPKATVQAAVGAIPLSAGLASGELILAIAVLSILITAPIGATLIKNSVSLIKK